MQTIDTEILQIVIGVPKSVGDIRSAEQGIQVFPLLLHHGHTGFTIKSGQRWQPARPALKDQWHESGLTDGRSLAGVAVENVRETITLRAAADNRLILESRINTLSRFINQARAFFATFYQIEPVYLEWAALGGKGSQYALIYTIDMSVSYDDYGDGEDAEADVQLVIEREPAWRGVPPGVSPRVWTFYSQGFLPGADYSYVDLNPDSTTRTSLVEDTINNRNEYSTAVDSGLYPSVSQNWIDIAASLIPGDAPALTHIYIDFTDNAHIVDPHAIYISRITKPLTLPTRESVSTRGRPLTINFADMHDDGKLVVDNTYGVKKANAATINAYEVVSILTQTFTATTHDGLVKLSTNMMRGKYNVFLRCRRTAETTTTGSSAYLTIKDIAGQVRFIGESYTIDDEQTEPVASYIGQIDIPLSERQLQHSAGSGLFASDNTVEDLVIDVTVTQGASRTVNYIDLILMPFDEPALMVALSDAATGSYEDGLAFIVDNTGYLRHGQTGNPIGVVASVLLGLTPETEFNFIIPDVRGQGIVLEPGINNRIAFLIDQMPGSGADCARLDFPVKVDIVPRWYGVRDA